MGYFVNPKNENNEVFLYRVGLIAPSNSGFPWSCVPEGFLPVILIGKGHPKSAVIACSESELESATADTNPRIIFFVQVGDLIPVTDPAFAEFAKESGLV